MEMRKGLYYIRTTPALFKGFQRKEKVGLVSSERLSKWLVSTLQKGEKLIFLMVETTEHTIRNITQGQISTADHFIIMERL